ncbi:MAG TPA: NAD(P)-dependent oxidoreductase [Dehalococcoidia bacterium]|nr:NAD(P)-dependent oxidoreductase [Dehalococcoidia bacterium]
MAAVDIAERPARILVGAFRDAAYVRRTLQTLQSRGIDPDFMGAIIKDDGEHANLLSVRVLQGRQKEVSDLLRQCGAIEIGEPSDLESKYGRTPHPGCVEDKELKMPLGREYPATLWPPAFSGYRVRHRVLDPKDRVWSFEEVELGYTVREAMEEANRCLRCPEPSCVQGCPVHNRIPDFIASLLDGDFARGLNVLRQTTNLPAVCGRVCDKARQCEGACVLAREGGDAVAIGTLERFLGDWEVEQGLVQKRASFRLPSTGKKVAVVGSGPSGLAVAADLASVGHQVTIFESLPVMGGALAWGIPAFRLPPNILDAEIERLSGLGVEFKTNTKVGVSVSVDDLFGQGYKAVFVGAGASVSTGMGIPGEDLRGVYTATEFLSRAKLSRLGRGDYSPPEVGERLAVIGAGNTAMDVAQTALRMREALDVAALGDGHTTMDVAETALRLGFRQVTVVYRRSEAEMPARKEEVESAKEEGTRFRFLTAPVRFIGDEKSRVVAMECIEMELGRPDSRGRREPVRKPGTEFTIDVDTVILALGYRPEPVLTQSTSGLAAQKGGQITADPKTGRSSRQGVWCGGDIVTGADTVVRAMGAGKRAAQDIDRHLRNL